MVCAVGSCNVPQGCYNKLFKVTVPAGYYDTIRRAGKIGAVEITMLWTNNANDFDLGLLDTAGNVLATSGFGNSNFEKIVYTQLPSGTYDIQSVVFRALNASIHVRVEFVALTPGPSSVHSGTGGLSFSNGTPVTFERSSGEPDIVTDPNNGDEYADIPLGAGTNSGYWKSTDRGLTWLPLGQDRPNQNPLTGNAAGGGDSQTSIGLGRTHLHQRAEHTGLTRRRLLVERGAFLRADVASARRVNPVGRPAVAGGDAGRASVHLRAVRHHHRRPEQARYPRLR